MSKGSGVTRGDRRRNARKARLRALVPHENAVAGLDLGEKKQALSVTGGDGQVLARRSPQVSVHDLGPCLDWAAGQARTAGYAGLSVACEPTGSWWMAVQDLCQARGLPFVCVQPLVSHVAREQEDLTGDKTDEGGSGLHCYVPERLEGVWAELREEGRRRAQLITNATAAKQLLRDKLGLVVPALPEAACEPFDSPTWLASLEVVLDRCGADVAKVTAMGYEGFAAAVAAVLPGWGGKRVGGTCRQLFAALGDDRGVARMRRAALRRAQALGQKAGAPRWEPSPEQLATMRAATDMFLAHLIRPTTHYRPDVEALRAAPARIVVAAGATSKGQLAHRSAVALADRLGTPAVEFPGDHGGFAALPEQCARVLDQVLTQPT